MEDDALPETVEEALNLYTLIVSTIEQHVITE